MLLTFLVQLWIAVIHSPNIKSTSPKSYERRRRRTTNKVSYHMKKCVILFRRGLGGGCASGGSITHVPTLMWAWQTFVSGLQMDEYYGHCDLQSKYKPPGGRKDLFVR